MLTIFSIPKYFKGHFAIIQANAITSWALLHPKPEIVLFGDEEGTAKICQELALIHEPKVTCNEYGTPLLNDIFEKAERLATYDLLCYVNADIILLNDFMEAAKQVSSQINRLLMVGRRYDVNITKPFDFNQPNWQEKLKSLALQSGVQRPPNWIDYFVFPKGKLSRIKPFAVGRPGWDNWLIWHACSHKIPVIDASQSVIVIHQNHDYSHYPTGRKGVFQGDEAKCNYELTEMRSHLYTIADAIYHLTPEGIKRNLGFQYLGRRLEMLKRGFIDWTRPIRHRLGIRQKKG